MASEGCVLEPCRENREIGIVMDNHLKIVSWLWIGIATVGVAVGWLIGLWMGATYVGDTNPDMAWQQALPIMMLWVLPMGSAAALFVSPALLAAVYLPYRRNWARIILIIAAFFIVLWAPPFSLVASIYTWWVLLNKDTQALFDAAAVQSSPAVPVPAPAEGTAPTAAQVPLPVAASAASMPRQAPRAVRVARARSFHVTALGWIYTVTGIQWLIGGFSVAFFGAAFLMADSPDATTRGYAQWFLLGAAYCLLLAAASLGGGYGLLRRKPWARTYALALAIAFPVSVAASSVALAIVLGNLAVTQVVIIPIALGIYTLWVMTRDEVKRSFGSGPPGGVSREGDSEVRGGLPVAS
jgi:hypothetical protein